MKKILLVLAIGAFAACNNATQEPAAAVDSPKNETVAPTVDSPKTNAVDSPKTDAPAKP